MDMRSFTTPSRHLRNVVQDDKALKVMRERGRAAGMIHTKNRILFRPASLPLSPPDLVFSNPRVGRIVGGRGEKSASVEFYLQKS
jgi:hypothetical protein